MDRTSGRDTDRATKQVYQKHQKDVFRSARYLPANVKVIY